MIFIIVACKSVAMAVRGIQIVGLVVTFASLVGVLITKKKSSLKSFLYIFWVSCWTLFTLIDMFPV